MGQVYYSQSKSRRAFLQTIGACTAGMLLNGGTVHSQSEKSRITLWQLPNQTNTQMNSYVMKTQEGTVLVIDGGCTGDAPYLRGFLAALGNHVHTWFISHPHSDHVDALTAILNDPAGLRIDTFLGSLPAGEWMKEHGGGAAVTLQNLNAALMKSGHAVKEHILGETFEIDGIRFEVLGIKNPEITANPVNNQCVVMRVTDSCKSILFTGDLGFEAGRKLLDGPYRSRLAADYVQMSHHGQNGVSEEFYREVNPSYCLWPTPDWLWDNDKGEGKDTGPWKTLEVREWMDRLNIKKHYVMMDGLYRIE